MKLETKHLAPYLPYELKCEVLDKGKRKTATLLAVYRDGTACFDDIVESEQGFEYIKPILRPLSDLTKEIEHNGEKFVPYAELYKIRKDVEVYKPINLDYPVELLINTDNYSQEIDLYDGYLIIQKLLEWHFDIFGLIERGLAIYINTLDK